MRFFVAVFLAASVLSIAAPPLPAPRALQEAIARGNVAFENKDWKTARTAYAEVLTIDPNNVLGLVNAGLVEFRSGHPGEARNHLRRAVALKPDTSAAWLALGTIAMDEERSDEALAALSQAIFLDPENAIARNFLGVVIGRRGWIDGAQCELRRAVELDPDYADAHYNLAAFYLQDRPPAIELARRHYQKARTLGVEIDPEMEKVFSKPTKP
jgi:tetratricopeptide (TPR) repeat protein